LLILASRFSRQPVSAGEQRGEPLLGFRGRPLGRRSISQQPSA
jgi:hypothetical protein